MFGNRNGCSVACGNSWRNRRSELVQRRFTTWSKCGCGVNQNDFNDCGRGMITSRMRTKDRGKYEGMITCQTSFRATILESTTTKFAILSSKKPKALLIESSVPGQI